MTIVARIYHKDYTTQDLTSEEACDLTTVKGGLYIFGSVFAANLESIEGSLSLAPGACFTAPRLKTISQSCGVNGTSVLSLPALQPKPFFWPPSSKP